MIQALTLAMPAALAISCALTALVYLGALAPMLKRSGASGAPLWRYFRNLESFRDLSEREGKGLGLWWLAISLTCADLCLALGLAALRLSSLSSGW